MSAQSQQPETVPRIEYLRVKNYRALRDLELKDITPLTVFLGPNGSGKFMIFDVFAFLAECFSVGLRKAWDRRGRFKELRTRGAEGPIEITLRYREKPRSPIITYQLAIDEDARGPHVATEWLRWTGGPGDSPYVFSTSATGPDASSVVRCPRRTMNASTNSSTRPRCSPSIHLDNCVRTRGSRR